MNTFHNIHFKNRIDFRNWLKTNHDKRSGIWMIFFKKHTGVQNISYDEAVEEALCFGWIDSTKKRVDDEKYAWKFTPRTNIKNWSDLNKKRVIQLIGNGLMTEAGLNKIDIYVNTGKVDWELKPVPKKEIKKLEIPEFITEYFSKYKPALNHFNKLAPSHKRNYVLWISAAKKSETRLKRLNESVDLLLKNEKLGMK